MLLALLLLTTPLAASCNDTLCEIDQQICSLQNRYTALINEAHTLNETANYLYWKQGTEVDVRSLRWRACRRRRTAQRVCCRLQKLQATREAIVRQAKKGVVYNRCDG